MGAPDRRKSAVNKGRALVVDDDSDIRHLVRSLLERGGFEVYDEPNGRAALRVFHQVRPDVVLLDVSMPELDGWQTLERIRDLSDVPVLMLTAKDAEADRVRGLRSGADDYVVKPFSREELLARVEGLLRRAASSEQREPVYADSVLSVDFAQRRVLVRGHEVALTPLEYNLLSAFVRHPNQVLSHDQLLDLAWRDVDAPSRDQVKLYIGYLRRKLGAEGDAPIETVRGFGYRYRPAR
jgi:DNA-binding response OmpR family regulator